MDMKHEPETRPPAPQIGAKTTRRIGYVVAAAVNLALLWVVHQLLDWDLFSFLTQDFDDVVPILSVSLVASALVNIAWVFAEPAWFKRVAQIGLNLISFAAGVRMWQVFPFDFSEYSIDWAPLARIVIGVGIVGVVVATIVEFVNLGRVLSGGPDQEREQT